MSVTEPSVNEATPSRTEASDIQQNTEELFPQLVLHAQGGSRRDAPSRSQGERDETPLDNLTFTPRSSAPSDGPAQVAPALLLPNCVEERGLLTYEDKEHRTNEHSVVDLIFHLVSTQTSTKNFLLIFVLKFILDSPKYWRYLIALMIRFRTRNKEETERETIPEADNALIAVDGNEVHRDLMTDCPEERILQEDEAIILSGIRSSPSRDSSSFLRTPVSTNGYPRFSSWSFWRVLTQYSVRRKFKCTPYVRAPVGKDLYHHLIFCIYLDHTSVITNIETEMKTYKELSPPQPMLVERNGGDIYIKLFDGLKENEKEVGHKRLGVQDLFILDGTNMAFMVSPIGSGASQKFLKLIVYQTESSHAPTLLEFPFPYDAAATLPSMPAGAQAAVVSKHLQIHQVSERKLETLSKKVPAESYTTLCICIDIEYNEANNLLFKFQSDYKMATRHCLAQWKNRTGGNLAELETILQEAELEGLVKFIK